MLRIVSFLAGVILAISLFTLFTGEKTFEVNFGFFVSAIGLGILLGTYPAQYRNSVAMADVVLGFSLALTILLPLGYLTYGPQGSYIAWNIIYWGSLLSSAIITSIEMRCAERNGKDSKFPHVMQ